MQHHPRKRFGQNFLHDPGVIQRILNAFAPMPGQQPLVQHLVEIGPGQGALTAGLLEIAEAVDVIELDRDLIKPLAERFGDPRLRIHQADALTFDLCALLSPSTHRLRLIGNLPYNISTPLLFRFLEQADCIEDLHLMLQKEVVDRIIAAPGSKVYGRLSVMVQTVCSAQRLFLVSAGAFRPAPKVSSAVVRLRPHRPLPYPLVDRPWHARLVAAAFAQRRKTLRNSLAGLVSPEQMIALGIDPAARAETLSIADFATLANASNACID
ncbi:16S rRNA (adenine(1518)-N(6)/adenine(1519)-N(6))-dimethyltransferase RsmA [Halochromatium salexigens]|uniref:Ribosomal RNA small subunit methyltransferase A n=1 Tax=Halochromatium salexigens TaxID=49447 RepID=A0AAJ0UIL1_HALSE|nr:16S rRNA (adenine(1518)-N(6)/adenine(1519)-N(6))-dimethyltransferase RsmA [Halochromatium salexigens]MBK5931430.1 16S rRNA (adenine(1518)-N(6)/adenine(1519)-N(6))-dimethyltransferase [Halochromatium salexigens]